MVLARDRRVVRVHILVAGTRGDGSVVHRVRRFDSDRTDCLDSFVQGRSSSCTAGVKQQLTVEQALDLVPGLDPGTSTIEELTGGLAGKSHSGYGGSARAVGGRAKRPIMWFSRKSGGKGE